MKFVENTGESIRSSFEKFHKSNPHVYAAFSKQVFAAIKAGRTKISAKLVINWIRWNEYLETSDSSFKINDAYQSYYARMFVANNPKFENIFTFRKLRNEESH